MRDCLTASKNHILDGLFPAATTALIVALDAVGNGGTRKQVLLCVTDRREARTTYFYKAWFGDGAAALTLGREDVIAECKASIQSTMILCRITAAAAVPAADLILERHRGQIYVILKNLMFYHVPLYQYSAHESPGSKKRRPVQTVLGALFALQTVWGRLV